MSSSFLFRGCAPALVTPFTLEGLLDEAAFKLLLDDQIAGGVGAVVVLGTTGGNPTISHDERRRLVDLAVSHVNGRVPVIIGTGTNDTRESVLFSREAAQAGADGLLVVGPYYNKPSQSGFQAHVAAIASAVDTPIIVYNVPGRTGSNIQADTMLKMAEAIPTVVGVKEASGDLAQISDILAHRPDSLAVYAGDDELAFPIIALGGDGVISVISNALPAAFCSMTQAALAGQLDTARTLHFELLEAMRACFYASNPTPVKAMLAQMGKMTDHVRLPLVGLDAATRERVLTSLPSQAHHV